MNQTILIGRLCADPEMRVLQSGTTTTRFTLAVDRALSKEKKQEAEAKGNPTADFPRIIVWGKQAEHCANYLSKGRMVAVQGRIQTGRYEKDGRTVYTTDVVADRVQFLDYGDRQQGGTGGYTDPGLEFAEAPAGDFPF